MFPRSSLILSFCYPCKHWCVIRPPPLLQPHTLSFLHLGDKDGISITPSHWWSLVERQSHAQQKWHAHLCTLEDLFPSCCQKQPTHKHLRQFTSYLRTAWANTFFKSQSQPHRKLWITPEVKQLCLTLLHILSVSILTTRNLADCCNSEGCLSTIYKHTSFCSIALSA